MIEQQPTEQGGLVEYRTHYSWAVIIVTIFAAILVYRFFQLQILRGEEYEKRVQVERVMRQRIPPRRGFILDRSGVVLADNVSEYDLTVVPLYLERYPESLPRLRDLLGLTDQEYGDIARKVQRGMSKKRRQRRLTIMKDMVHDRCPYDGETLEMGEEKPFLWCPACGTRYEVLGRDQRRCVHDETPLEFSHRGRVGRCPACGVTYVLDEICPEDGEHLQQRTHELTCPRCGRSFDDQVAIVTSHLHELSGLKVITTLQRRYPLGFRFSHLLGYMNQVNGDDLKRHPGLYRGGDTIGRSGLERSLEGDPARPDEPNLRGVPGEEVFFRDQRGFKRAAQELTRAMANLRSTSPIPGDTIRLTVDVSVQRIVERAMRYVRSGAAVVLDVNTGRVLALYSKPGFDPNVWSGRLSAEAKKEYDENLYSPMINKALTAYPPGSVWKVIVAVAALEEGVVDPDTKIHCPGHYDFGGRRFHCHKRSGHGDLNLTEALKHSCDTYFYRVGEMLGMDRLERYSREVFGMGLPTGIETYEQTGRVPSKDWHRRHSPIGWQPGFTLSSAVGQGAVLATPLQIARLYATIANGGRVLKVRSLLQLEDADGEVRHRYMPDVERVLGVAPEHLAIVQRALVSTVVDEDGTGHAANIPDILVAGKTGTAQAEQHKAGVDEAYARWLRQDHGWFAAYAPADDPQISVVVFLDHGGSGGKHAAPVVKRIIERYFREGHGRMPEPVSPGGEPAAPSDDLDGIR